MVFFAEAGTTNGTHMVKFKKGAFAGEKRITPLFLKFDPTATMMISYEVITQLPLVIL